MVMQRPECPFIAIDLFNKEVNTIRGCFLVKSDVKTHYTVVSHFSFKISIGKRDQL